MAKDKKSFVLYLDNRELFDDISDEDAGKLIKHIFSYVSDENPKPANITVKLLFIGIKSQLKRDLKKYDKVCKRNKDNGLKGGRPKNPKEPKKPSGLLKNPAEPKKADSDNDSVNDNESDIYKQFDHLSISKVEFERLKETYTEYQINTILDAIQNYAKNKNYKSLYLTSLAWLKKEYKQPIKKEILKHQISELPEILDNAPLADPQRKDWQKLVGGKK